MSWGAVIGAAASLVGGKMSANSAASGLRAQQQAADRLGATEFNPYTVFGPGGMGFSAQDGQARFNLGSFEGLFEEFARSSQGNFITGGNIQNAANQGIPGLLALSGQAGSLASLAGNQAFGLAQNGFQRGLQDQLFSGASATAGRLNQGFDGIRDETLALLRAQAQPFETRQFQGLQDTQFAQGIGGSSGGALQTEAFARGLGQADITRQLAASGEARATQSSLQSLLGAQLGGGQGLASLENSLMQDAFNRFGATSSLAGDLNTNIFNRGGAMQQQGMQALGGQQALLGMLMSLGNFGANLGAQDANTRLGALGGQSQAIGNFGAGGDDVMASFLASLGSSIFSQDSTPFGGAPSSTQQVFTQNSGMNTSSLGGTTSANYNPFAGMFGDV